MTGAGLRPPACDECIVSFPAEYIMLVTINRPKKMNTTNRTLNWQLHAVWGWFDDEPSLRVAIITGQGTKAFCAVCVTSRQITMVLMIQSTTDPPIHCGRAQIFSRSRQHKKALISHGNMPIHQAPLQVSPEEKERNLFLPL